MKKPHSEVYPSSMGTKKMVDEVIFTKRYDGAERYILFSELPPYLKPDDKILVHSDDGYMSENNAWDPYTEITIYRPRIETDEEFTERLRINREYLDKRRDDRYELYLKLKTEFENGDNKGQ